MSTDIVKTVPANHLSGNRHTLNKHYLKNCPATVAHKKYFCLIKYFGVTKLCPRLVTIGNKIVNVC